MIYTVFDMLPFIGSKLDGSGVDSSCEPGTSRCLAGLNKATRMLMVENQSAVSAYMQIGVAAGGIITLDRRIKAIWSAKIPGHDQMDVVGPSYRFLDGVSYEQVDGADCGIERLEYLGNQFAVQREPDIPRMLFAVSDRQEDVGATVTVLGIDEAGKEIRSNGVKGISLPITYATCETAPVLPCPDAYSSGKVARVSMIRKPRTKGYVQIWGFDQITGDVFWLTTIAPDEINPGLTRYHLNGAGVGETAVRSIYCYVLLQFCEMFDMNDVSLIQQPEALEYMTQAIAANDASNYANYQTYRNAAVAWVRKDQRPQGGNQHKINVQVRKTPLRGHSYALRPSYRRRF